MKAVVVHEHGGPEVLRYEERPDPVAGPGEVLIRIRASALNHLDLWVRRGLPGHEFPLPMILGSDGAGEVAGLGPGTQGIEPGARVAISPGHSCGLCPACLTGQDNLCKHYGIFGESRDGTCAEFVAVPAANVIPLPDDLPFPDAASVGLVFLTAWHMLVERCQIRPGDRVLVHAAGSGIGSAAVQIARLWGATVIATASSTEKLEKAREIGADHTVNYEKTDWVREVRSITGQAGIDIVFEHVGASTWAGSMKVLGRGGRVVTCGATTGFAVDLDLRHLFFKSLSILGSTMGGKGELLKIWQLIGQGKLRPIVDRTFPLSEIQAAHRHIEDRQQFGKVVLISD